MFPFPIPKLIRVLLSQILQFWARKGSQKGLFHSHQGSEVIKLGPWLILFIHSEEFSWNVRQALSNTKSSWQNLGYLSQVGTMKKKTFLLKNNGRWGSGGNKDLIALTRGLKSWRKWFIIVYFAGWIRRGKRNSGPYSKEKSEGKE